MKYLLTNESLAYPSNLSDINVSVYVARLYASIDITNMNKMTITCGGKLCCQQSSYNFHQRLSSNPCADSIFMK